MKGKKILTGALTGALALSLAVPALAADTTVTDFAGTATTDITGTTEAAHVQITVPSTGSVILNPYKLTVELDGGSDSDDQIISDAQFIENASNLGVKISATVTGTVAGNAKLATASLANDTTTTTNSVFMYFEMLSATDGSTEPTWATSYSDSSTSQILVGTRAATKADLVELGAATDDDGSTYAAFHLAGDAVKSPKTAWAATDTVNVSVAFTFTPVAND